MFGGMATLALGYASNPITGGRGWRDIPRLKWPVIALAWGLVTGWLPLQFLPSASALGEWTLRRIHRGANVLCGRELPSPSMCAMSPSIRRNCARFRSKPAPGSPLRWPSRWSLMSMGAFYGWTPPRHGPAGAVALIGIVLVPSVRHEWVFSLWLDGCLILQGVLAFLFA